MSDKIQKVQQRSQAAAHHLVHTSEPFDFKKAGRLNLKENHNHVQHRNVKFQVVNPSNQPASPRHLLCKVDQVSSPISELTQVNQFNRCGFSAIYYVMLLSMELLPQLLIHLCGI